MLTLKDLSRRGAGRIVKSSQDILSLRNNINIVFYRNFKVPTSTDKTKSLFELCLILQVLDIFLLFIFLSI